MTEHENTKLIMETFVNLISPMMGLCHVVFTIFLFFGIIGELLFGGKINADSMVNIEAPPLYKMMNFNDMPSAMITLFALMLVNNWQDITRMLVASTINNREEYWLFFMLFYYCSVVIGMNIFIAFILDMYDSVLNMDRKRKLTLVKLRKE